MKQIDEYLDKLDPAKRKALERIRALAKATVPEAEEAIMYAMPTLKSRGKPFLGFSAHKNHIGIYPYSGSVLPALKDELADYGWSKGALRVSYDKPIPAPLLKKIITLRLKAIRDSLLR